MPRVAVFPDEFAGLQVDGNQPAAVGQLKYYPWLKNARPTALPENRGLTAWKPVRDTWAFGAGFGVFDREAGNWRGPLKGALLETKN